jgi:peptidyl-prolyl cis-trans isomerase C
MQGTIHKLTALVAMIPLMALSVSAAEGQKEPATKPPAAKVELGTNVVAKGKGLEIKRNQLDEAYIALKGSAAARGQTIPENQRTDIERRLLDRLIFTQLLLNKANAEDKAKGKEAADKAISQYKSQERSEEAFNQQLKALGTTREQFDKQVLEQAVCEQVLDRELKSKVAVSDAQVKKHYEENSADFEHPEQVRAAHVLISIHDPVTNKDLTEEQKKEKKKLAEKILERAKAGEDFAKLAKEFSDDPGSKDSGGEYTFARGRMVPEFEAAAFSLKTNQVSDVVTTKFGYHIIKLQEKIPAQRDDLAKVTKDIRDKLASLEIQKQLPDYLDKLKADAGVEIVGAK